MGLGKAGVTAKSGGENRAISRLPYDADPAYRKRMQEAALGYFSSRGKLTSRVERRIRSFPSGFLRSRHKRALRTYMINSAPIGRSDGKNQSNQTRANIPRGASSGVRGDSEISGCCGCRK